MPSEKRLKVVFFRTPLGTEPVRDWVKALPAEDCKQIGEDIRTCELGWPIGMPTCRSLGEGLWEVRTSLKDRIARIMFLAADDRMVLLHGFIKKSQVTPASDLKLARLRQKEWKTNS